MYDIQIFFLLYRNFFYFPAGKKHSVTRSSTMTRVGSIGRLGSRSPARSTFEDAGDSDDEGLENANGDDELANYVNGDSIVNTTCVHVCLLYFLICACDAVEIFLHVINQFSINRILTWMLLLNFKINDFERGTDAQRNYLEQCFVAPFFLHDIN